LNGLVLKDCLVGKFTKNLISASQLTVEGEVTIFLCATGGRIISGDRTVPLRIHNNLYAIVQEESAYASTAESFHTRLGHASRRQLAKMGLPWNAEDDECGICRLANMKDRAHKDRPENQKAQRTLQSLSADTCGPLPESDDGFRYFIVAVDDATRFVFAKVLRSKGEAAEALMVIIACAQRSIGAIVAQVRVDGAPGIHCIRASIKPRGHRIARNVCLRAH